MTDRVLDHNRRAWNREVANGNPATQPVDDACIARARAGDWSLTLGAKRPIPAEWIPSLPGLSVLCLAASGGQQVPVLAAAGAQVTALDLSPCQLGRDREVADRCGLDLRLEEGDMRDLSRFADESFGLVVLGLANQFIPDLTPLWQEIGRVLVPGGSLIAAFLNPVAYIFDQAAYRQGVLQVRHRLPYSDLDALSEEERTALFGPDDPLEFGHSLEDQIGGQVAAGLQLEGFVEDYPADELLSTYLPLYCMTRAVKRRT